MAITTSAKVAHNFPRSFFETSRKRCNSNDTNPMFEQATGELRAKLLWRGPLHPLRATAPVTGHDTRSEGVHCLRIGCSAPSHKNKRGSCETQAWPRHPRVTARPPPDKFRMQFTQDTNRYALKNRRISTIRFQHLKYTQGNCMRNYCAGGAGLRCRWAAGPGCGARGRRGLAAVPVGGGAGLRCPWAAAGPGRASRRRADQRPSPTGVEGAGGTGGHGRASRRGTERSEDA